MEENPIPVADLKRKFLSGKKPWLVILLFLLILAFLPGYYFYNQYQKTQQLLQNSGQNANLTAQLVKEVGKLIELPIGEIPTIATVSDATKLSDQPFFANAQNGDKVLIYAQAKKAILYRPSIKWKIFYSIKIIEISPINLAPSIPQATPSAVVTPFITPIVTVSPTVAPSLTP